MPTEHDLDENGREMIFYLRMNALRVRPGHLQAIAGFCTILAYIRLNALPTNEPQKESRCPITAGRNKAQALPCFHTCFA